MAVSALVLPGLSPALPGGARAFCANASRLCTLAPGCSRVALRAAPGLLPGCVLGVCRVNPRLPSVALAWVSECCVGGSVQDFGYANMHRADNAFTDQKRGRRLHCVLRRGSQTRRVSGPGRWCKMRRGGGPGMHRRGGFTGLCTEAGITYERWTRDAQTGKGSEPGMHWRAGVGTIM